MAYRKLLQVSEAFMNNYVDESEVSAPLFVIGGPRTPVSRRRSESDDDVRILPSSSREREDSGDDVVEID